MWVQFNFRTSLQFLNVVSSLKANAHSFRLNWDRIFIFGPQYNIELKDIFWNFLWKFGVMTSRQVTCQLLPKNADISKKESLWFYLYIFFNCGFVKALIWWVNQLSMIISSRDMDIWNFYWHQHDFRYWHKQK